MYFNNVFIKLINSQNPNTIVLKKLSKVKKDMNGFNSGKKL